MLVEIEASPLFANMLSELVLLSSILGTQTGDIIEGCEETFTPDTVCDCGV